MKRMIMKTFVSTILLLILLAPQICFCQDLKENPELDRKVKAFLEEKKHSWYDMNVPAIDGQLLYDIIVENGYTRALEIGTSTGHSAIWMAWALSKTGGKLITIEIDERRYRQALQNFEEAGLSSYIDARLADAHRLVKELEGPFDFVFSDADKNWYKNYFIDIEPRLVVGGCFTAHNISQRRSRYARGQSEFLDYVRSLDNYETNVNSSGGGVSISYKKSK
ncbi:MAG: O-methyltransferase [Bacteroidota bacterium]